jgi:Ca2+-transporting ATPase
MKLPPGLSSAHATRALKELGLNEIVQTSKTTPLSILFSQFKSPLVLILIIATAVSLFLGDTLEGLLIIGIVVLNAALGFFQEYRAEKALSALKQMTISMVRVLRDGGQKEIDSKYLVPRDVIFLEEGNKIPADCLILESLHLEVDESSLTGESMPVEKNIDDADSKNIFLGTTVAKGRCIAEVTSTGMQTKFGSIARSLATIEKEETPLEKKLGSVAKMLGLAALIAVIIISVIGIGKQQHYITILLTAISLAVAAVPEGLPAVITITLAIGTQRMAKKKAILRKLSAIEALGGITVIATDKTGTLTKNEMHVVRIWTDQSIYTSKDFTVFAKTKTGNILLRTGSLCNNASLAIRKDHGSFDVVGDRTEGALLLLAAHVKYDYEQIKNQGSLLEEFAFDATSKTMSVVYRQTGGTYIHVKGAPESILNRSTRMYRDNKEIELSTKEKLRITKEFEQFAKEGLRVIALATKKVNWNNQSRIDSEQDLTFIGFVGISDPPRPEVAHAIQLAREAHIRTIMITGDNELTAYAIARHIGLIEEGNEVMTGTQFASLSVQAKLTKLPTISVFARTTPEQKLEIVQLLQKQGHIVAVTGDGVNDALALKQANVGVAMGITGTDVAKEAAEMVITDDNYATIVTAVEEGRIIYDNMKASIKYLIGSNIGEILSLLVGAMLGWPYILLPIQILYINLITDGLPALALALNTKHHNIMRKTPRTETELFNKYDYRWFIEVSSLTTIATLLAFSIGWMRGDLALARTLAFVVIALAQQYIFFDTMAGEHTMFSKHIFKNKWVIIPVGVILLQVLIAHTILFQSVFKITSPHWQPIGISIGICSVMIVIAEIRKKYFHRFFYSS